MPTLELKSPQSLEELMGKHIGVSEWLRVTQERIAEFAETTEDRQWIHLDGARAVKESPYGTTIAHGFLILSMVSRFLSEIIRFQNPYRELRIESRAVSSSRAGGLQNSREYCNARI